MDWSGDVQAADWLVRRLHPFAVDVGSLVPDNYPAYVRILHPARLNGPGEVKIRWATLARDANTALQPTTQFESLTASARLHIEPPRRGALDADELAALIDLLAAHTSQPESCWFAVWDGYGWIQGPPAMTELRARPRRLPRAVRRPAARVTHPRIHTPDRSFLLWRGPIEAATTLDQPPAAQSPNLWWPNDQAWCVASDIDLYSTYVGGSTALIDQILRDRRVEALPANVGDSISAG
jgi:hypothetical protein